VAGSGRKNAEGAVLAALAAGATQQEAAERVGVSERTVRRWLADATFRAKLTQLQREMTERALATLTDCLTVAALTLRHLMLSAKGEAVRLGAARSIFEVQVRLKENAELKEELRLLAQRMEEIESCRQQRRAYEYSRNGAAPHTTNGRA
jgi:hypothetical protein